MKRTIASGALLAAAMGFTFASAANAAPEPPSGLKSRILYGSVEISWLKSPDDPLSVSGYEVVRSVFINGPYLPICETIQGAISCVDRSIQPEQLYYYKVRSLGGGEGSPFSTEVTARLPSEAPPPER